MRIICLLPPVLLFVCLACSEKSEFDPGRSLGDAEREKLILTLVHYCGRSPEGITFAERFYSQYDTFYANQASKHRLEAYALVGERQYFLLSRNAPSLTEKKVGIGGYVIFAEDGNVSEYRELFRTWKMAPDTLSRRGMLLFRKMVKKESLESFETRNSGATDYIEFPDERVWFDTVKWNWELRPVESDSLK